MKYETIFNVGDYIYFIKFNAKKNTFFVQLDVIECIKFIKDDIHFELTNNQTTRQISGIHSTFEKALLECDMANEEIKSKKAGIKQ